MAKRVPLNPDIETTILIQSKRRCALCFGLNGDLRQKPGQIAHIDRDSSNSEEQNLAFLCLTHHDEYDSKTSQSKGMKPAELVHHKAQLIGAIASGEHATEARTEVLRVARAIGCISPIPCIRDVAIGHAHPKPEHLSASGELGSLEERANERLRISLARQQSNLESIVAKALPHLRAGRALPLDDDWLFAFIEQCQNVGNEDMQQIWAKILAGEISKTGAFSMRALTVVRTLTRHDALLFTEYCRHLVTLPLLGECDACFDAFEFLLHDAGLGDQEFLHLSTIGLLNFATLGRESATCDSGAVIRYYDSRFRIRAEIGQFSWDYRTRSLTGVGRELFALARDGTAPVPGLFEAMVEHWRSRYGCSVEMLPS